MPELDDLTRAIETLQEQHQNLGEPWWTRP